MPTPKREAILSALYTTLQTISVPTLGIVSFQRNANLPLVNAPELVLVEGSQTSDYRVAGQVRHLMSLFVEGFIEDDNPGAKLNELFAATIATMLGDITVGGLTQDLQEGYLEIDFERGANGKNAMQFSLELIAEYYTTHADPYIN